MRDNCKFLEKLIRFAWHNGYEYQSQMNSTEYGWNFKIYQTAPPRKKWMMRMSRYETKLLVTINLEAFWFDHDFIRVLCELAIRKHGLVVESEIKENTQDGLQEVLKNLARTHSRVEYLRETFGGLVECEK